MDKELFNKLPYEKQTKLENMALRSMLLEFSVKEYDSDKYATLNVRPMYKDPYGDEYRCYNDNYSVVKACGKHLFANMQFVGHVNANGSSSFTVSYEDFYYSVGIERAKNMYNTLKWLDKRIHEEADELYEYGSYSTFSEYITAVTFAIDALGGLIVKGKERKEAGLEELFTYIAKTETELQAKYAPVEEAEKEVA